MQSIRKHITKRAPMRAALPGLVPLLLVISAASAPAPISPERVVSSFDDTFTYEAIPEIVPVSGKPELLMWRYGKKFTGPQSFVVFSNGACELLSSPGDDRRRLPVVYRGYAAASEADGTVGLTVSYSAPEREGEDYVERYIYDGVTVRLASSGFEKVASDTREQGNATHAHAEKPEDPGGEIAYYSRMEIGGTTAPLILNQTSDVGSHKTFYFPDPTHRSGVVVFGDDATGTTVGVVKTTNWASDDVERGWRQDRRFWQEKEWSLNVTSFGWSRDGRYLFVATSDIYGTGEVYQLDVDRRRWAVLFPREREEALDGHCWSSEIERIGDNTVTFYVRDYCDEDKIFVRRTVPFLGETELDRVDEEKP